MTSTNNRLCDLPRWLAIWLAIAILLGTVFVHTRDIAHTPPGLASDTIWNLADALRISQGVPYPMAFGRYAPVAGHRDESEPLHRFLLGAWFKLLGPDVFTAQLLHIFLNLITVALTYRAGCLLFAGQHLRRLAALIAMGAVAGNVLLLFLSRTIYRTVLVAPVALVTLIMLMSVVRAGRQGQNRRTAQLWLLSGFVAALGVHTYQAGIVIPVWSVGLALHQIIFGWVPGSDNQWVRRFFIGVRHLIALLAGMIVPLLAWAALIMAIPGLFYRVEDLSTGQSLLLRVFAGLRASYQTIFVQGSPRWPENFNTAGAPLLNPVLAVLCLVGIAMSVRYWQRAEGALLLGGMIGLALPGAISGEPQNMLRFPGVVPVLALLAGWGALATVRGIHWLMRSTNHSLVTSAMPVALMLAVIPLSVAQADHAYQGIFADPAHYADPHDWLSVPHIYTTAFIDTLNELAKADRPTYVPLWLLDNPAAAFFLQRQAYPNVTTWSRYGLKTFPPGQFYMPALWYYHTPALDDGNGMRVLLLPREKTMVILPPSGVPADIAGPPPEDGKPGVTTITNTRGWVVGRTRLVAGAGFSQEVAQQFGAVGSGDPAVAQNIEPTVSTGLRILTPLAAPQPVPGQTSHILIEWRVLTRQPADLASVGQMIRSDMGAVAGGDDHWIMPYLYPSGYWQPGDIIPDWHEVQVPADLPDGVYRWGTGVYVVPHPQRLDITPPAVPSGPQESNLWLWDAIRRPTPAINTPLPAGAIRADATLAEPFVANPLIRLEGYRVQRNASSTTNGGQWTVTLYWRAAGRPGGDYTIFVHAAHGEQVIAQNDQPPTVPTWAWQPGELITTEHTLTLPADNPAQPDTLYVGMYSYPSLDRLTVRQSDQTRTDGRIALPVPATVQEQP